MRKVFLFIIVNLLFTTLIFAQTEKPKLYYPSADAKAEIAISVKKAKAEKKHVLLQVGGNW